MMSAPLCRHACNLASRLASSAPRSWRDPAIGCLRHINIFTVFNKEERQKETERLKDEMNRGYFDDFRDLKKTGGKVFVASENLVPVIAATKFPKLVTQSTNGDLVLLPFDNERTSTAKSFCSPTPATLVCLAFRAHAEKMVESWTEPFLQSFKSATDVKLFEVSVVESWLLSLQPFKSILLRIMKTPAVADNDAGLQKRVVYAFGNKYFFRKELGIPNILSGYAFLLDKCGRVRWRASGLATTEELDSLVKCTVRLLQED